MQTVGFEEPRKVLKSGLRERVAVLQCLITQEGKTPSRKKNIIPTKVKAAPYKPPCVHALPLSNIPPQDKFCSQIELEHWCINCDQSEIYLHMM